MRQLPKRVFPFFSAGLEQFCGKTLQPGFKDYFFGRAHYYMVPRFVNLLHDSHDT